MEGEVEQLTEVIDSFFPKINDYVRDTTRQLHTKGYVESYFGRKRRFPIITNENRHRVERQARNMRIQSAGSDLNLLCMLHLWEIKEEYDIYPLLSIHDSIVVEVPNKETVPILKKIIEDRAYEIVKGAIPFLVDADWGYDWSMRKQ